MIWLLAALLGGATTPSPPGLIYTGQAVLNYDLLAEVPWMPLLWQRLGATVPDTTATLKISAKLITVGTTHACDDNDLLSLRSGSDVVLNGTHFTVGSRAGTWSGPVSATNELTATFTRSGADAEDALQVLRQLHYANLGGPRTLVRRRVEIHLISMRGGTTLVSPAVLIDIQAGATEGTPLLRFDPQTIQLGSAVAWRPIASFDSRPSTAPTWLLQARPTLVSILGNGQQDVGTTLINPPVGFPGWSVAAFVDNGLRLRPDRIGNEAFVVRLSDGGTTTALQVPVTVEEDTRTIVLLADMPLELIAGVDTTVPLVITRAGTWTTSFVAFPGSTTAPTTLSCSVITYPNDGSPHGQLILRSLPGARAWISGILVITDTAPGNPVIIARIPFRIHVKGTAG